MVDAPNVDHCQRCGRELGGEAAYIEQLNQVWCHPCADDPPTVADAPNTIAVILTEANVREGILDHQVELCPKCGGPLIEGFGLAGGGLGVYGYCDPCGRVIWKCLTET
jgi:hypothetical protein